MVGNTGIINSISIGSADSYKSSKTAAPLLTDVAASQINLATQTASSGVANNTAQPSQTAAQNSESVRVSSSIGRAASVGQLTREQALEIYRNIARFL